MPLSTEVLDEIDLEVRGGFEDRDRIIEIFLDERYEPGELDETELTTAVDAAITQHHLQKRNWPAITDCDKLAKAFKNLNNLGIIALHNAGYTQSDGYSDVMEVLHDHPDPESVIGYCYYHGQDLERALQGGGLYFAFGPIRPNNEQIDGPKVGALITTELHNAGFTTEWNGTFSQRISVPIFDWKNR